MTTKRKPRPRPRPERKQPSNGSVRQPSIHLVRIPRSEARELAFRTLIDLAEMWVRLPGGIFGLSTRQVEALKKQRIPFEPTSQTANAKAI